MAIGMTQAQVNTLSAYGLTNLAAVAFSCSYVPGAADDAPVTALMAAIWLAGVAVNLAASFRRVHFESYTIMSADLRARVESTDSDVPRRLANAERSARFERQKTALVGMTLVGELEPSYGLIDLAVSVYEANVWTHIAWDTCTKRDQELQGVRKEQCLKVDSTG